MNGFLNSLMEGQNLSELNQMAVDGDPKHLGVVGRNLQLMAINNRNQLASDLALAQSNAPAPVEAEPDYTEYDNRIRSDREEAMRRTGFKLLPKAQRVAALPDSDEAVDEFLKGLR